MRRALQRLGFLAALVLALGPVRGAEDRLAARRARILADPGASGVQGLYRELAVEAMVSKRIPEGLDAVAFGRVMTCADKPDA